MGNSYLQKTPHHLQSYYALALTSGRTDGTGGLSSTSVLYHHRIMSEALSHAVKMEMVARNVAKAVELPRRSRPEMATLFPTDITAFLDAAQNSVHYVLFCLLLCTGLRRGEALALRWSSIEKDMTSLSVTATAGKLNNGKYIIKEPKTRYSRRMVALPASLGVLLHRYRSDQEKIWCDCGRPIRDNDFVFGRPDGNLPDPASITRAFSRVIQRAGLNHIRLHDLRHTHATLLLKAGVHPKIVSERLGHAGVAITLDLYSHVLPGLQETAAQRFDLMLETSGDTFQKPDVSKMLATADEGESEPSGIRTRDTLIKSQSTGGGSPQPLLSFKNWLERHLNFQQSGGRIIELNRYLPGQLLA